MSVLASANNGGAHAWVPSEWHRKMGNTVGSLSEVQRRNHRRVFARRWCNALQDQRASRDQPFVPPAQATSTGSSDIWPIWCERHRRADRATGSVSRIGSLRGASGAHAVLPPVLRRPAGSGVPEAGARRHSFSPVWFMDDGCRSRSAVYLNTAAVRRGESADVASALCMNSGGSRRRLNRDKSTTEFASRWRARSSSHGIIEPYLLPELRYKLPQVTP